MFAKIKSKLTVSVLFLSSVLVYASCMDDDFIKKQRHENPGPHDDGSVLFDASKGYVGKLTPEELKAAYPSLLDVPAEMSVMAYPGRDSERTRIILIFPQSFFGQSIKKDVQFAFNAAIFGYQHTDGSIVEHPKIRTSNMVIFVDSLKVLPDVNKFAAKTNGDSWSTVKIASYKDLYNQAYNLLESGDSSQAGAVRYGNGKEKLYQGILQEIEKVVKGVVKDAAKTHGNPNDIAILAYDPILSAAVMDVAAQIPNIKHVSVVNPMMALHQGKAWNAYDDNVMDKSYANVAYKNIEKGSGVTNKMLAFNSLRTSSYFFDSLIGGDGTMDTTYSLTSKYVNEGIRNLDFTVAAHKDSALSDTSDTTLGQTLFLRENATTGKNIGLASLCHNFNPNIDVVPYSIGDKKDPGSYNFPTTQNSVFDATAMLSVGLILEIDSINPAEVALGRP